MVPGQPHSLLYLFPESRGWDPSCCGTKGLHAGQRSCVSCWEGPTGHRAPVPTTDTDLVLFLLHASRVLLSLVSALLSLATLIPRGSDRRVWISAPGDG